MWRSLVAHLTGGQGVAGSNPVIPTIFIVFCNVQGNNWTFIPGASSSASPGRRAQPRR